MVTPRRIRPAWDKWYGTARWQRRRRHQLRSHPICAFCEAIADDSGSGSGHCAGECQPCREWYRLHNEIHVELNLKPWEWPCLPRNPYPPGSPKSRKWRPRDPGSQPLALWAQLNEAAARRSQQPATDTA